MSTYKVKLLKPYSKQQEILAGLDTHRYVVAALARRTGKTIIGMTAAIKSALDSGLPVLWCSISYKQLITTYDMFLDALGNVCTSANRQQNSLKLLNGARIDFFSLDNQSSDSIRGKKYNFCVIDEAAYATNLLKIYYSVISPTLVDYLGKTLFISSPNGYNDFYTLYTYADNDTNWYSLTATTYDNPFIDNAEIERLKKVLPDKIFRTEMLGEFLGEGKIFSNVLELSIAEEEYEPQENSIYVMGIDLALQNDFTVIVVLDITRKQVVRCIRVQYELKLLTNLVKEVSNIYKPAKINIDATGMGIPIVQALHPLRLPLNPITFTKQIKEYLIHNLIIQLEQKNITLLRNQNMINELSLFEEKNGKYNAPSGYHDDIVIALSLACWELRFTE
jgi:phage FluMu gp28-like protein